MPYVNSKTWFGVHEAKKHDAALNDYQRQAPTHILFRARAYALTEPGLSIGSKETTGNDHLVIDDGATGINAVHCRLLSDSGNVFLDNEGGGIVRLNGKPLSERSAVGVGDKITLGNPETQLLLISIVEDTDGP